MPFIAVSVTPIPEEHMDSFNAAWPAIASEISSLPMVLGVSGGPIVGEDGVRATSHKFLQTIGKSSFATKNDYDSYESSAWLKDTQKDMEARAKAAGYTFTRTPNMLYEVAEFPNEVKPKAFTQMSRIIVTDESKLTAANKAWQEVIKAVGKNSWGGRSVGGDKLSGLGFIGWDSAEECMAAFEAPMAKELYERYEKLGETWDVLIKLTVV